MQSQKVNGRRMKDGVNSYLLLFLIFSGVVICFGSSYLLSLLGVSLGASIAIIYGSVLIFAFMLHRIKWQREEKETSNQRRLKSRASKAVALGAVPVVVQKDSDWQMVTVSDQKSVSSNKLVCAAID